ncbi:DUF721 domain-containing protein [Reichenbachiella ulvae]|uniref:DUF721 domain-containing protein n=1 Tax=Reichenbachiella ulvae TaxID=2980104 RepID=A0ABT3CW90_9BACT|nr:DUF721 domain-containing protein [Reichenbachiella ulvae]MCV9387735.1 DUF721 domain-containing protein [Reichenbachiella ulvae]
MKKRVHPAAERKRKTVTMKDLMEAMLKSYNIEDKFDQASLITRWERIMGAPIANRTSNIEMRKDVLIVTLSSAPLKHELNSAKQKIVDRINEDFGRKVINQVLFV